jgi:membrane-associated phospholipid phosphatase
MLKCRLFFVLLFLYGTVSARDLSLQRIQGDQLCSTDSLKAKYTSPGRNHTIIKSCILPFTLVSTGIIVEFLPSNTVFSKERIQQHVQDKMGGFSTSADNYLQFVPMAAMFGLNFAGVKSKSDLVNQAVIAVKSEILMTAIVTSMKYFIHDMRPDGSSDNTMPSGHTAQAFVSATLLDMEYRETSPWISVGGYLCATATGFFRVANNRHWTSDVLIGAGIGIASVKAVYLTHRYKWGKMPVGVLVPVLYPKGGGVAFAMRF